MAQLAIKGHATRGKEVIQLLETLGGINSNNLKAISKSYFYYIKDAIINIEIAFTEDFKIYTLEEFEEKFPYKVGDKVTLDGFPCTITGMNWEYDDIVWEIESMQWINNEIKYIIQDNNKSRLCDIKAEDLQPYKEENMEEPKELIIGFTKDDNGDWVLNTHKDYEIKEIEGKYKVIKKKPQYPKDYEECEASGLSLNPVNVALAQGVCMGAFAKLIVLRNAYWEIAGKQLGLDKPWKPDWEDEYETYYTISYDGVNIKCYNDTDVYSKLTFPTEEMRDAFFENFKDLIEQCKELL